MTQNLFAEDNQPLTALGGVEVLQGMDDIKITTKTNDVKGRVLFDEAFAKADSSLTLKEKGKDKVEMKGEAEGANGISYKVDVKVDKKGKAHGKIDIKQGKHTVHTIKVEEASFKDRSVEGTGYDKKTKEDVSFLHC